MRCQEVRLTAIPEGQVTADHFGVFDADVPVVGRGQVVVGVRRLGLNAGLAHRLGGKGTAYGPGIGVGDVPASDAVVEVLESADDRFGPGDLAVAKVPWSTASVIDGDALRIIDDPASDEELNAH